MARYNYECKSCRARAEEIKGGPLEDSEVPEVLFETSHSMNPSPQELVAAGECPRCLGHDTAKSYVGVDIYSYVRGYGYLDRAGCHRDMNLHKLTGTDSDTGRTTDPYSEMRTPGEVDELKARLQRGGKHISKPTHFTARSGADMEAAVVRAVSSPPVDD